MNNRHQWRNNVSLKLQEMDTVVYLEFIRNAIKHLPGVNEKPCYNTPGFYANKKLFARMKEDGETLVVQTYQREKWMQTDPNSATVAVQKSSLPDTVKTQLLQPSQ